MRKTLRTTNSQEGECAITTPESKRAEPLRLKHRYANRRLTDEERSQAHFTCQHKKRDPRTLKLVPVDGYFGLGVEPHTVYEATARCSQYCEQWKSKDSANEWEPCYRQGQQHFEFFCPRCLKYHKTKQRERTLA